MDLLNIDAYVKKVLSKDFTGHDYKHIKRVVKNANEIIENMDLEPSDRDIVIASCLVHDLIDYKVSEDVEKSKKNTYNLLKSSGADEGQIEEIFYIIENISFSENIEKKKTLNLNGQIVQDADRLDAIGAIGIARTFYYGGSKKDPMYGDVLPKELKEINREDYKKSSSAVDHFFEKLLKLKYLMNTKAAKKIAQKRHDFMVEFLEELYREIGE